MKLDLTQTVGITTLKALRDFIRRHAHRDRISERAVMETFGVRERDVKAVIMPWVEAGFVAVVKTDHPFETPYELTDLGRRLRNAKALKRIPRGRAEAIMKALLAKVQEVNATDDYAYVVDELRVFGSYLDPDAEDLGDIDVSAILELRRDEDIVEANLRRARASGKVMSYLDELNYGETEVKRALKKVSRHISLHSPHDLERIGAAYKAVFTRRA